MTYFENILENEARVLDEKRERERERDEICREIFEGKIFGRVIRNQCLSITFSTHVFR